jgi:hypothetical protein
MLRRIVCSTICVTGLAGTLLLSGCGGGGVDKSGPPVSPQNMDAQKQQQYKDFMKSRGQGGTGGAPGGARPPGSGGGEGPTGNAPMPSHG